MTLHTGVNNRGLPLRLFAVAFVISVLITVLGGWSFGRLHSRFGEFANRQLRLTEYIGHVMLFDEALTMSALMMAATGDPAYEQRYDRFDAELDTLIKSMEGILDKLPIRQFVEQTNAANRKLVAMERRAFALTHAGQGTEASELLRSKDYLKWKEAYADGMRKTATGIEDVLRSERRRLRNLSVVMAAVSGAVALILLLTWFMAIRAGRAWADERMASEAALRSARDDLELRVVERTVDLEKELAVHRETKAELAVASAIAENSPIVLGQWHLGPGWPLPKYISANFAQFGYTSKELLSGATDFFRDIVHPDDREQLTALIATAMAQHRPEIGSEFRIVRKDGDTRWVEGQMRLVQDPVAAVVRGEGTLRDITERKIAEDQLKFANILLASEIEASPDGVLAVQSDGLAASYNRKFLEMWSIPPDVADLHDANAILAVVLPLLKDADAFRADVLQSRAHPERPIDGETALTDGRVFEFHFAGIEGGPDGFAGRINFFRDITERKRTERQISELARSDALTGLPNRRAFVDALEQALARARRGDQGFAVLYLDLDHFKDINDTLGHPVGDLLLQAVAQRLRANIREIDTVARFGGDEFAIIEADIREPADATVLADKLLKTVSESFSIQGNEIRTGTSVGITIYGPEASNAETLLLNADIALYRAKSEGRGIYRFFTDAMDDEVRARVTLATELRAALETGQLFLLYQPQVDIQTRRIAGLEAMVRWNHPGRGEIGADEFVPMAEQSGLIVALGHWMLQEACRQTRKWLDAGIDPCVVAMKVSRLQFKTTGGLEGDIAAILAETQLTANRIELEVTESVLMELAREHNDALVRLRRSGLRLAIDDFGTGYSSLGYLRQFPVDRIKIAQVFIRDLGVVADYAAIAKATVGLALALDLNVIATGVETKEQLELLEKWGCREAQGSHFAWPLPPDAITELLWPGRSLSPGTILPAAAAA